MDRQATGRVVPHRRILTVASVIAIATSTGAVQVLGPLLTSVAREFGNSVETTGNLVSAQQVGYFTAVLTAGHLSDRLGTRAVVMAGLLILTVSLACFAVLDPWPLLLAAQLLVGLGQGGVLVSSVALVSELNDHARSSAVGLTMIAMGVGSFGATRIAGVLLKADFLWTAPVFLVAGTNLLVGLLFVPLPSSHMHKAAVDTSLIGSLGDLLQSPAMRLLILISSSLVGAQALLSFYSAPHLEIVLGAPVAMAALAPTAFWVGMTIGRVVYSLVIERLNQDRVWIASTAISALFILAVPFLRDAIALIWLLGVGGAFVGMVAPPTFSRSTAAYPQQTGIAAGLVAMSAGLGAVVSVSVASLLIQLTSLASVYWLIFFELLVCLFGVLRFCNRSPYRHT